MTEPGVEHTQLGSIVHVITSHYASASRSMTCILLLFVSLAANSVHET